eukprot:199508_1
MSEAPKCRKELVKMMKEGTNKHCADCNAYPATWASTNLGVFLCLRCSGIHRGLGVHISFVKSASLDDWNLKLLTKFKEKEGNVTVNQHYEATLPESSKLHEHSEQMDVVKFIHLKYVKKIWYKSHIKKIKKKHHHHHKNKNKNHTNKNRKNSNIDNNKSNHPPPQQQQKSDTNSDKNQSTKPAKLKKRDSFLTNNELDLFHRDFNENNQKQNERESEQFDVLEIIQNSNIDQSPSNSTVDANDNNNNNGNNNNNNNQSQWVGFDTNDDNVDNKKNGKEA